MQVEKFSALNNAKLDRNLALGLLNLLIRSRKC